MQTDQMGPGGDTAVNMGTPAVACAWFWSSENRERKPLRPALSNRAADKVRGRSVQAGERGWT